MELLNLKERKCKKCGEVKSIDEFYKQSSGNKVPYTTCKACLVEPRRAAKLKREYGITPEEYNSMFAEQEGSCKICNKHQSELDKRLCVDHDHATGRVRGLLCAKCNQGLGLFQDSVERIAKAIKYLEARNER